MACGLHNEDSNDLAFMHTLYFHVIVVLGYFSKHICASSVISRSSSETCIAACGMICICGNKLNFLEKLSEWRISISFVIKGSSNVFHMLKV